MAGYNGNNPEIEALVEEYGIETVRAAFAVAHSIGQEGIRGIDFSGAAASRMRQVGPAVTKNKVKSHIRQELRK